MTNQGPEGMGPTDPSQSGGVRPPGGAGTPADLGPRFLARLIDHVLLGIVISIIIVPIIIASAFAEATGAGVGLFTTSFSGASFISGLVSAVIVIAYFALMESQMGQTVGKMVLGLRTEGPNGGKPTLEQAIRRNAWYALAIIPILGGLAQLAIAIYIAVTISNSATRTGWHDTFAAGTRVVRAR
jgi:uncharacterized RDD family membrane protein YckC